MQSPDKIYVAGHHGMVGSAIMRKLKHEGYSNLIGRSSRELDLRDQSAVHAFLKEQRPEYVFLVAGKVGGIHANNTYPADFLYDNVLIVANVIHASYLSGVKKLLFLGSSCIYPRLAPQPIKEDHLLSGKLEPTNEAYALAKITGVKLCQSYRAQYGCSFIAAMPTNVYGPNDNYDLNTSHVLPALIRKFHMGKVEDRPFVECWGTGAPMREFLHVDDLADACYFLMKNYDEAPFVNVGTGEDLSIKDLAELVREIVGYRGQIRWDDSKPDGTPRKLLDVDLIHSLGWHHKIELPEGIRQVYRQALENQIIT